MKIFVNEKCFDMPWKVSMRFQGWVDLMKWFQTAIDDGYEFADKESSKPTAYPRVRVVTTLPQQVVIGVAYASDMQFGRVSCGGEWNALWYCAPLYEKFEQFLDNLRIAEHNFSSGKGTYCFGSPRWMEDSQ